MKTPPKTLNATIAQLVHGNALRSYIINVIIAHNGRISIAGIAKLMFRSREAIAKHIRMLEAMRAAPVEKVTGESRRSIRPSSTNSWAFHLN